MALLLGFCMRVYDIFPQTAYIELRTVRMKLSKPIVIDEVIKTILRYVHFDKE